VDEYENECCFHYWSVIQMAGIYPSTDVQALIDAVNSAKNMAVTIPNAMIEVEDRFDTVDVGTFERVKSRFHSLKKGYDIEYTQVDYIRGEYRRSVTTLKNGTITETYSRKIKSLPDSKPWIIYNTTYPFRTGVSIEVPLTREEYNASRMELNPGAEVVRTKKRVGFTIPKSRSIIDCTEVTTDDNQVTYEIERDYTFPVNEAFDEMTINSGSNTLKQILAIIEDTEVLYSLQQGNDIIAIYNNYLDIDKARNDAMGNKKYKGSNRLMTLSFKALVQARNLKLRDLVWGGLLGGKCRYYSGIKANGFRRALAFTKIGIWLLYPPRRLCLLPLQPIPELDGIILDTEDIPIDRRKPRGRADSKFKTKHYCTPFDIMVYRNSIKIQDENLITRMDRMKEVINLFMSKYPNNLMLHIEPKPGKLLGPTANDLFRQMKEMDDLIEGDTLDYEADGTIITPVDAPYNPHSDRLPLHKRSLTLMPDVCKVKKWEDLTIDFTTIKPYTGLVSGQLVNIEGELLSAGKGNRSDLSGLVPFEGTMINSFDINTQVDWTHPLMVKATDKTIIEYAPKYMTVDGVTTDTVILVPKVIRNEKPFPNLVEFAKDIWDDINHPIRPETLHGEGVALMRYYHNNNKRDIWNSIPDNAFFVDIGSGNGGDAAKWRRLFRGLAIEPDPDHIVELKRRLDVYSHSTGHNDHNKPPLNQRVKVVKAYGQDAELIVKEAEEWLWPHMTDDQQPLVITSMLTLSFFDDEGMKGLARTIKGLAYSYHQAGGLGPVLFKFFTITGDAVRELIHDKLGDNLQYGTSKIVLANVIEIIPETPNSIYINIKDTIVTRQLEYLVDIGLLLGLLQSSQITANRADVELLLNEGEMTFSKLFIYGTANVIAEEKIEPIQMAQHELANSFEAMGLNQQQDDVTTQSGTTTTVASGTEQTTNTATAVPVTVVPLPEPAVDLEQIFVEDVTPIHTIVGYPGSSVSVTMPPSVHDNDKNRLEITISPNDGLVYDLSTEIDSLGNEIKFLRYNSPEYGSTLVNSVLMAVSETYRNAKSTNEKCVLAIEFRRDIMQMLQIQIFTDADHDIEQHRDYAAACAYIGLRKAFANGTIEVDVYDWLVTRWPQLANYDRSQLFIDPTVTSDAIYTTMVTIPQGDTSYVVSTFPKDIFVFMDEYFGTVDKYVKQYSKTRFFTFLSGDMVTLGLDLLLQYSEKDIFPKDVKDPYMAVMTILKRQDELDQKWIPAFAQVTQHAILVATLDPHSETPVTNKVKYLPGDITHPDIELKMLGVVPTKLQDNVVIRNPNTVISSPLFDLILFTIGESTYYETEIDRISS
jgi:hypothetical protein